MFELLSLLLVAVRLASAAHLVGGGGLLAVYGVVQVLGCGFAVRSLGRGAVRPRGWSWWAIPLLYTSPMWFWALPCFDRASVPSAWLLWPFALEAVALLSLGRSFTLGGPVYWSTVERGPYRLIRHPQYLAFLLVCLITSFGFPVWLRAVFLPSQLVAVGLVICLEEGFLLQFEDYRAYRSRVRAALVPMVF